MTKTKKRDFVEIKFTGYANGDMFDSNIEEDIKKLDDKAKPKKTLAVIGEGMLVKGFDAALADKEVGKEYEIELKPKDAFGPRDRNLIKTIPLKVFQEQKVNPQPGMVFSMDNSIVKIIAVSGARVTADFNNPLSGKDVKYKFKIEKIIQDDKEKAEALFLAYLQFTPEFEVKDKEIIAKGPEPLKAFVEVYKDKFKDLLGKELKFEIKESKPEKKEDKEKNPPSNTEKVEKAVSQ